MAGKRNIAGSSKATQVLVVSRWYLRTWPYWIVIMRSVGPAKPVSGCPVIFSVSEVFCSGPEGLAAQNLQKKLSVAVRKAAGCHCDLEGMCGLWRIVAVFS